MFSGIIEIQARVLQLSMQGSVCELTLEKPENWTDLKAGDSIAVNGVCLTLVKQDTANLVFELGPETLKITKWDKFAPGPTVNLERSLRLGDRIHGHFVTGHVDTLGFVESVKEMGESVVLTIQTPPMLSPYLWKKGSVALNGVSLTINESINGRIEVCLIPETLRRTNLGQLKTGNLVTVEVDNLARGLLHQREVSL